MIVIGAGPAGEVAAGRLADRGGKRVALVERHLVGGECAYYACMPSKALLRPAEVLREAGRVPGAAEAVSRGPHVDAVLARRDEVIHELSDDSQLSWIEKRGIELFRGGGRLSGERRVLVGEHELLANDAVVAAVGSAPLFPPIDGLAEAGAWSNRQMTTSHEVPRRLMVLGGGVVGVEMAQAWASLGSRVVVVEALDRLLPAEEPVAGEEVRAALVEQGVEVRTGARMDAVSAAGQEITLHLQGGDAVVGDRLLVAVGRKPLTEELGLENVGLKGGGFIEVDDSMRAVGVPWLYAVGDVNGRSMLTHSGKYQARIASDNILGERAIASTDTAGAPRVVFTDPQVAAVGMTAAAAEQAGLQIEVIDLETSGSAGGSFYGRGAPGTSRFVVDAEREVLVGVTLVGAEIPDFLQAATIAVVGEVPLTRIAHAVAPFPTRSELWLNFVEAYENRRGRSLHAVWPAQ